MKLRVTLALFALFALSSSLANAQMSEGEKKAAARAAYTEGVALQDKGNPAEALLRFEAAQKLFDAPTHLLHIAECQTLTGKLVEASETYETLIRKPYGKDAPEVFVQAQEQGRAELAQLRPRIPTVRVLVKPEPQTLQGLQININDKQMPAELVGIARPVNPGAYRFTAYASGWGTPGPVDVEIPEKESKTVELTLRQGAAPAVAVVAAPAGSTASTSTAPAPYEQPTKPAVTSPSPAGLLLGIRPAIFFPTGEVSKGVKVSDYTSTGWGAGIDVIGRVARLFLVGGTLELADLGEPDPKTIPFGQRAEVSTTSVYAGVFAGIMPNVDRFTFVADAGFGMRFLSHTRTTAAAGKIGQSFSGLELAINAGFSIPVGPFRIVPKAGLAFGEFSNRNCTASATSTTSLTGCASDISSAPHMMLNLAVGLYYHFDFSKKAKAASTAPITTTAAR
jgi:hypothetical protein